MPRKRLFQLQFEIEKEIPEIHTASLSLDTVVYKLRGVPDLLSQVLPELRDEEMRPHDRRRHFRDMVSYRTTCIDLVAIFPATGIGRREDSNQINVPLPEI